MKSYQVFMTKAARPIGIWGSITIVVIGLVHLGMLIFSTPEQHKEFAEACTLVGGTVQEIEDNHYCVTGGTIRIEGFPSSIQDWFVDCRRHGGTVESGGLVNDSRCAKYEIIKELGERDDYIGGQ